MNLARRILLDRNRSIDWAQKVKGRPNDWVIWDTETTGLGKTAEIIQIGVIGSDRSVILDSFVRPLNRKRMPPDAQAIHGITMKMLKDAPSYPDLAPRLIESLRGKWIIAYNAEFEERMLGQTAARNGGPGLGLSWDCAMRRYANFVGEWTEYRHDYKWQKLPGAGHHAVADCLATLDVINTMANSPLAIIPRRWWEFWKMAPRPATLPQPAPLALPFCGECGLQSIDPDGHYCARCGTLLK